MAEPWTAEHQIAAFAQRWQTILQREQQRMAWVEERANLEADTPAEYAANIREGFDEALRWMREDREVRAAGLEPTPTAVAPASQRREEEDRLEPGAQTEAPTAAAALQARAAALLAQVREESPAHQQDQGMSY